MEKEYSYPIDLDWSTDEVIKVTEFFHMIEESVERDVDDSTVKKHYLNFKSVVPSKSEEKSLFKAFEKVSGIEPYQIVKHISLSDK